MSHLWIFRQIPNNILNCYGWFSNGFDLLNKFISRDTDILDDVFIDFQSILETVDSSTIPSSGGIHAGKYTSLRPLEKGKVLDKRNQIKKQDWLFFSWSSFAVDFLVSKVNHHVFA